MQHSEENWFVEFQKRYEAYIEREEQGLFEYLKQTDSLQPRMTPAKIAALVIAILIHSITLILPILGIMIFVTQFAGSFSICYTLIFLGIAIVLRPRFNKLPENIAKVDKFPALYRYIDQIADHLPASHIDFIAIDELSHIAYSRVGLRQSRLLTFSHLLWQDLTPHERVALIANGLAHSLNGDLARNFLVSTAIHTLEEWYVLFYPTRQRARGLEAFTRPFMLLLVIRRLLLPESRRSEYLADQLAASISGTEAMISMLKKWHKFNYPLPIATHPPIHYRIAMLEAKPSQNPTIEFSDEEMAKISAEMNNLNSY